MKAMTDSLALQLEQRRAHFQSELFRLKQDFEKASHLVDEAFQK